jgi:uncharacterized protein (DUF433 family)
MANWQQRISISPDVLVGKPVIAGTRIAVELIVEQLGRGWTEQQIREQYDHITPEDIHACLMYAAEVLKSEKVYPIPA